MEEVENTDREPAERFFETFPDIGFSVAATCAGEDATWCDFKAYRHFPGWGWEVSDGGKQATNNIGDAYAFLRGSIKWDGCSDWEFAAGGGHFCSVLEPFRLAMLFFHMYDIAQDMLANTFSLLDAGLDELPSELAIFIKTIKSLI